MFQPHVFFSHNQNHSKFRKRGPLTKFNSMLLAEREGATATSLGLLCKNGKKTFKIIHRVPSVEGATATSLGNLCLIQKSIKINRKKRSKWFISQSLLKTGEQTMERTSYSTYSIGKGKAYLFEFKLDTVFAAQELGVKPTARKFKLSVNTVRSWLRKFKKKGKKGLKDGRKGPLHIPNKISSDDEEKIVSIRKMIPCFGPVRIKHFFKVHGSLGAIQRVIRSHGLTRKRKKVYQKRRDLRAVKAKRPSMTHLQMDVKYLRDIPNYWEQLKPLNLPYYQYTVRDTKSGMLFLGYSDELSELNARMMIDHILAEIKLDLPFNIKELTVQTDNGSEFSGQARRIEKAPFVHMIEKIHGANHQYIRPGHCNANADVESSHELIETEFFDLTRFVGRDDFFKKVESYRLYFNFVRPNFYKGIKTPEEMQLLIKLR